MSARSLSEVAGMISNYEKIFAERGDSTPSDPLEFHLYHLARYWSRLLGLCRIVPSNTTRCVGGNLGACVQVGSKFTHKLIKADSPIYGLWQDYWTQTQAVLHQRSGSIDAVEAAHRAFEACLAELKYDPWA